MKTNLQCTKWSNNELIFHIDFISCFTWLIYIVRLLFPGLDYIYKVAYEKEQIKLTYARWIIQIKMENSGIKKENLCKNWATFTSSLNCSRLSSADWILTKLQALYKWITFIHCLINKTIPPKSSIIIINSQRIKLRHREIK